MCHTASASDSDTKKYALLGHPVAHSLSPAIHNAAFQKLGIPAVYDLCDTGREGPEKALERLLSQGYQGFNVTMPDKRAAAGLCQDLSPASLVSDSVNTICLRKGRLFGTTTDGDGFLYAAERLGLDLKEGNVTLLGGGGAASSMLTGAALAEAASVNVFVHRTSSRERMTAIAERLSAYSKTRINIFDISDTELLEKSVRDSLLLANATNVGMSPDTERMPLPSTCLCAETPVFDAIYEPRETFLLKCAKKTGCQTVNGLPMLVGQAAASFRLWTGQDMPVDFILSSLFSSQA